MSWFIISVSAIKPNPCVETHLAEARAQKLDQKCAWAVRATMDTDSETQSPKPGMAFLHFLTLSLQIKP